MAAAAAEEAVAADSRPLLRPRLLLPLAPPRLCTEKKKYVENEKKICIFPQHRFLPSIFATYCYTTITAYSIDWIEVLHRYQMICVGMKEMCQLLYLALISSNIQAAASLIAIYTEHYKI